MMGDPQAVATDLGVANNGAGFGLASGGMPPEGVLYGHSFGYALGQLLALQTAGRGQAAGRGGVSPPTIKDAVDPYLNGNAASRIRQRTPHSQSA